MVRGSPGEAAMTRVAAGRFPCPLTCASLLVVSCVIRFNLSNIGLSCRCRRQRRPSGQRILRRMPYKIEWIGTVALGVSTEGGQSLAFSLADGQQVPPEFKVGDPVKIVNYPEHPSVVAMGMENVGYYEFTQSRPAPSSVPSIGTTCTKLKRRRLSRRQSEESKCQNAGE